MVFPVVMYGCENWTIKEAECQRIEAFELWCWKKLLSPLDCKEIKPVNPKGNQSWIFIGRTDAEAERGTPSELESGLMSNTQKWIVWGDTCADKAIYFIGKGHLGGEQEGKGSQGNCSATWLAVSGFMGMWLVSVVSGQSFWLRVLPGGARIAQPRWIPARRILGDW